MIKYRIFHKILNKSPQLLKLIKYNKQQQYVKYKCIYKFNKEYSTLRKMNKYYNTLSIFNLRTNMFRVRWIGVGMFVGLTIFGGSALNNREEAEAPLTKNEDATVVVDGGFNDNIVNFSELMERYVWNNYSLLPTWQMCKVELSNDLLLLSNSYTKKDIVNNIGKNIKANGKRLVAIPTLNTEIEEKNGIITSYKYLEIKTSNGDVEYLRNHTSRSVNKHELKQSIVDDEENDMQMIGKLKNLLIHDEEKNNNNHLKRFVDVTFPSNWTGDLYTIKKVLLNNKSKEYKKVEELVLKNQAKTRKNNINGTFVKGKIKVKNIYRIQSPKVWECYMMRKRGKYIK